jgi:hypothetical protein
MHSAYMLRNNTRKGSETTIATNRSRKGTIAGRTRFAVSSRTKITRSMGSGLHPSTQKPPVRRLRVYRPPFWSILHPNRFAKIKKEMRLLNNSTFSDYMQPFGDTQDALFRLLSHMRITWIPESSTVWELSKLAYADTNLTELSESVLSCPICLEISSLGLYYTCTHECCSSCAHMNEQKVCGQCRQPPRPSGDHATEVDDARLRQFNGVMENLLYRCPCGRESCTPTTFTDAHNSQCPGRFLCPLKGDNGCRFAEGAGDTNLLVAHLMQCHPMKHLWAKCESDILAKRINRNIVCPWTDKFKLIGLLGS